MFFAPDNLPKFGPIAERHPALPLIIDHMGLTLEIGKDRRIAPAIDEAVKLAKFPNVSIKLSAAPNFSQEAYPFRDMTEHLKRCFDAFGEGFQLQLLGQRNHGADDGGVTIYTHFHIAFVNSLVLDSSRSEHLDFLIFRDEATIIAAPQVIIGQILLQEAGIAFQRCHSSLLMKILDLLFDTSVAVIGGLFEGSIAVV
jgi:hypothetical protein